MLSPFVQRKLALAFYQYDQSKNGLLEKEDLQLIAKRIAESFGLKKEDSKYQEILDTYAKVWDHYLSAADTDGDGKVSLIEFFEVRGLCCMKVAIAKNSLSWKLTRFLLCSSGVYHFES
ncbi:MAG: EF-hand domain-containing protein, partial [Okeania sp. SIO4D6]|nr:EF-hand domain-containing protein [Okeania sp. SIO4D6]